MPSLVAAVCQPDVSASPSGPPTSAVVSARTAAGPGSPAGMDRSSTPSASTARTVTSEATAARPCTSSNSVPVPVASAARTWTPETAVARATSRANRSTSVASLAPADAPVIHSRFPAWAKANRGSGKRPGVASADLKKETMLLLGAGHCFRDQVLGVCPELMRFSSEAEGIQKTFEGSSLETIRQMVASGVGITVLPKTSVPEKTPANSLIEYLPFRDPAPDRRVVLVWRKSFTRTPAIEVLRRAILKCPLPGSTKLDLPPEPA